MSLFLLRTWVYCVLGDTILVNVYIDLLVLRVLPVLYRPEVVDIGVNTI